MLENRNRLINILFDKQQAKEETSQRQQIKKQIEDYHLNRVYEENIFIPRSRNKQIRIIKISGNINRNLLAGKSLAKRMFVDGSTIKDLIDPKRERVLYSQGYKRHIQGPRLASPEMQRKPYIAANISHKKSERQRPMLELSQQFDEVFESYCRINLYDSMMKDRDEIEESTQSSSTRNTNFTIRQRKANRKNFVTNQTLQQKDKDRKAVISLKKQLFKFYSNPQLSPENITAKSYVIFEHFKEKVKSKTDFPYSLLHSAFNSKINLQIASLTKITTCLVAIQVCQRYNINMKSTQVTIGRFQCKIQGTSAELQPGDIYTIQQLLYGLMLPSGNDASIALSVYCGQILQRNNSRRHFQEQNNNKQSFYRKFIMQMNKKGYQLGMKRTLYSNSHGLTNSLNKGCASDLVIIIDHALRKPLFRKIIASHELSINVQNKKKEGHIASYKQVTWENTHELLQSMPDIYKGIKTGTTEAAGHCLASLLELKGREFVIIVLNSKSNKWRYRDTQKLRLWLQQKQFRIKQ